jgi:transcriptional regulator with XRE-family HTH domain
VKLYCKLSELRGDRSLRHVATEAGVSAGQLSMIEQGRALPRDRDIERLEQAYGAPFETWYTLRTLVAMIEDEVEQ